MQRILLIAITILLGLSMGALVGIKNPVVERNVKTHLEKIIYRTSGIPAEIEALSFNVWPPGLDLSELRFYRQSKEEKEPWFSIKRISLALQLWPNQHGDWVLNRLVFDGLSGKLELPKTVAHVEEQGGSETNSVNQLGKLPFDIQHLALWNTNLSVQRGNTILNLRNADFEIRPQAQNQRTISFDLASGHLHHGERDISFETTLKAKLHGSLAQPQKATIEHAYIDLKRVSLAAAGDMEFAETGAHFDVGLKGKLNFNQLRQILGEFPEIQGNMQFSSQILGSPANPSFHLMLQTDELYFQDTDYGQLQVQTVYKNSKLQATSFHYTHQQIGKLTGSGELNLSGDQEFVINSRMHNLKLEELLERVTIPNAWVRLDLSGEAEIAGKIGGSGLALKLDTIVHNFQSLDRSYKNQNAEKLLNIRHLNLKGRAYLTKDFIDLENINAGLFNSTYQINGRLRFAQNNGFNLRVKSANANLKDIGPIAGLLFLGNGEIAAALEGAYAGPTISGTLNLNEASIAGYRIGDLKSTIIYNQEKLKLERISGERDGGQFNGGISINFAVAPSRITGSLNLYDVPSAPLLRDLGIDPEEAKHIRGKLQGMVSVNGALTQPNGFFEASTAKLSLAKINLGSNSIRGGFFDRQHVLWVKVKREEKTEPFKFDLAWTYDDIIKFNSQWKDLKTSRLQRLIPQHKFQGTLSGQVAFSGPFTNIAGDATLNAKSLSIGDVQFNELTLQVQKKESGTNLVANLFQQRPNMKFFLDQQDNFTFDLALRDIDSRKIIDGLPSYSFLASGRIKLNGNIATPENLYGNLQLDEFELGWLENRLVSKSGLEVSIAKQKVKVQQTEFNAPGLNLLIAGSYNMNNNLDIQLKSRGDLSALSAINESIEFARGPFKLDLFASGPINALKYKGGGNISNAALLIDTLGEPLNEIEMAFSLKDRSIEIPYASAQTSRGQIRVNGSATFPLKEPTQLDFEANLDRAQIRPIPEMLVTTTGRLHYLGNGKTKKLSGNLNLDAVEYTENLELEHLIPRRQLRSFRQNNDGSQPTGLSIKFNAPNNLNISNSLIEAELQADLLLTGTVQNMGLIGTVSPLWAKVKYRENTFELSRGSINFTEEYRIFSEFDFRATTNSCGMDILVDIQGNSDSYHIIPSGKDSQGTVNPQDALACLQFGLRLEDFRGTNAAGINDTLPGSLDALWTVSGLDEKVRKLLPAPVIDQFRLTSGWSSKSQKTTPRLLIGKGIGQNMELTYSRSLEAITDQEFSLRYKLSKMATVQGTWASDNEVPVGDLGLDLKLRWEFR